MAFRSKWAVQLSLTLAPWWLAEIAPVSYKEEVSDRGHYGLNTKPETLGSLDGVGIRVSLINGPCCAIGSTAFASAGTIQSC